MTKGLRSIRPLQPESLRGLEPSKIAGKKPAIDWVDPKTLFVEESYQRDIAGNGLALIRKIYAGFDWSRFKLPVCVRLPESGNVLVCIDGQHTATACASHPGIDKIPVLIVSAATAALRAASFVGHNRDRLNLTPPAIFRAELAAGDPIAVAVTAACEKAGAIIMPKSVNLRDPQPVGSTIAIGTIKAMYTRQGEAALVRVLTLLVNAARGPIKADEIAAVGIILAAAGDLPGIDDRLAKVVASKTTETWAALGAQAAAESAEQLPAAVARVWCRELDVRLPPQPKRYRTKNDATAAVRPPAPKPANKVKIAPPPTVRPPAPNFPNGRIAPPAAPKPKIEMRVTRNGAVVDFESGRIEHRGQVLEADGDVLVLVGCLLRVMPAMLPFGQIAHSVFGGDPNRDALLPALVRRIGPDLEAVRLAIKTVPKMGHVLYDLGPPQRG